MEKITVEELAVLGKRMSFREIASIYGVGADEIRTMASASGIPEVVRFSHEARGHRAAEKAAPKRTYTIEARYGWPSAAYLSEQRQRMDGVAFTDVLPSTLRWESCQPSFRVRAPSPQSEARIGCAAAMCVEGPASSGGRAGYTNSVRRFS